MHLGDTLSSSTMLVYAFTGHFAFRGYFEFKTMLIYAFTR